MHFILQTTMSRSRKKPVLKDNYKNRTALYWRTVRRVTKLAVRQGKEIPSPKTIINDYDYSDYITDARFDNAWATKKQIRQFSTK